MPGQVRPNKKTAKLLYELKKTPQELQQKFGKNEVNYPGQERIFRWRKDSEVQR